MDALKEEILELLGKDKEFRYAVAGYLGLVEILERMDRFEENQEKLWEEVRELRKGQEKMWENQEKLWESQEKLWENQEKLWEEVRALRRGQEELRREQRDLYLGLKQLGGAVGMTLDHYTAAFIEGILVERGYDKEELSVEVDVRLRLVEEGEEKELEVDLLSKDPFLVGEVKTCLGFDDVEKEVGKLFEKKNKLEKVYGRKVEFLVFAVENIEEGAAEKLRKIAEEKGIMLFVERVSGGVGSGVGDSLFHWVQLAPNTRREKS